MCATNGCTLPQAGNSKYCRAHKAEARAAWRQNIADQSAARDERYARFADILTRAHLAGSEAGRSATPAPMVVAQHANQFDDTSPVTQSWFVSEGACGRATVVIRPGNSSFARWLTKHGHGRARYHGGISVYPNLGGTQSYERYVAAAHAMADVIHAALPELQVYTDSWMD